MNLYIFGIHQSANNITAFKLKFVVWIIEALKTLLSISMANFSSMLSMVRYTIFL